MRENIKNKKTCALKRRVHDHAPDMHLEEQGARNGVSHVCRLFSLAIRTIQPSDALFEYSIIFLTLYATTAILKFPFVLNWLTE